MPQTMLIRNVRVFDGSQVIPDTDVLVKDGTIIAIGHDIAAQQDMQEIDGTNRTLLPSFIDAHTHVFGSALRDALIFGVTTELDMFTDISMAAEIKRQQAAEQGGDMADLRSATAGAEWQQHSLLFSDFGSIDTRELLGITFAAGGQALGAFQFQIDDVRLTS